MGSVILSAAAVLLLAGAPAEPKVTVTVPAACAGVWTKVYVDFDRSWTVDVLPVRAEDERLPEPEVLEAFLARVPDLETALAKLDAADRDLFYVRVKTRPLAELQKKYPRLAPALLEAAKVETCRDAAGK